MKHTPIAISWLTGAPPPDLDERDLNTALAAFLDLLGHAGRGVILLVADDGVLRELNRRFRGQARPTDILSWSYGAEDDPLLGELAISLERSRAQALENGWDIRTEMLRLLAHGCAHLAGFDHETGQGETRMRAMEIKLLAVVGVNGIYPES